MNYNTNLSVVKKQSGVILVLALVILLVLTMLIVSSMTTTNMQVLMTGNTQHHTQALNDAETALRIAESAIDKLSDPNFTKPATGYKNIANNNANAINFSTFKWLAADVATVSIGSRYTSYVIEYTGSRKEGGGGAAGASIGESISDKVPGETVYLYRVTARGTSARGTVRIVQSMYKTAVAPL